MLTVGGVLIASGAGIAWWQAERVATPVLLDERFGVELEAEVLAVEPLPARERSRLLLSPRSQLPAEMILRVSVRDLPKGVGPGARVRLSAGLSPPPGPIVPGGYHFARRAWFEGIGATGFAMGEVELLEPAPEPDGLSMRLQQLRTVLTARLQEGVGGAEGGVAAALVTGERGGIPEEVTEAMRGSGLAHLIAISGLHIAVVVGGTLWLVRWLLVQWGWFALRYDARLAAAAVAALAGIAYTLIAGAGVPTVRACIAVLIVLLGLALGREAISLRLVAAGATLILLWQPHLLLSPSFQLSFAAVTGIVALYQSRWGRRWSERDPHERWTGRAGRGVVALLLTGLVAEAAIAPIALFHFNQVGLYGAAANLIAIPLTSFVIIPLLVAAVFLMPLGVAAPVYAALKVALSLLIGLAGATAGLPGAVAVVPAMPPAAFLLIVAGGLWLCLWQSSWRWYGALPALAGILLAAASPRPELFVGPEGRHLAWNGPHGLAMLRPQAGDYVTDMWSGAGGAGTALSFDDLQEADCTDDACVLKLVKGGRTWRILATRSADLIPRESFEPACAASDIVVSERYLPGWCRARWLTLDARELGRLGSVAIDLDDAHIRASAREDGNHPWAPGGDMR